MTGSLSPALRRIAYTGLLPKVGHIHPRRSRMLIWGNWTVFTADSYHRRSTLLRSSQYRVVAENQRTREAMWKAFGQCYDEHGYRGDPEFYRVILGVESFRWELAVLSRWETKGGVNINGSDSKISRLVSEAMVVE